MHSPTQEAPSKHPGQLLAWQSFQFQLPTGWEVTAYSTSERTGHMEFNTRYGVEAQLSWQTCKKEQEVEAVMNKFHKDLLQKRAPERFKAFDKLTISDCGEFKAGFGTASEPCQAAHYQRQEKILLRWIFPNYNPQKLQKIWKPILESYQPNLNEMKRWAIFGLEVSVPKDFELETVLALPANTMLVFEGGKRLRLSFHRWGMPELLLSGRSLAEFYEDFLTGGGCKIIEAQQEKIHGMEGVVIEYSERAEYAMDKLYGRWQGKGTIWYNKKEQRIYAFEQVGHRKATRMEMNNVIHFA